MAINHGSLSAELTPRGVVGGRVQNSVIAYENDYERLINKPSVNNVELDGDLSLEDLGIVNNVQPDWEQDDTEAEDYIKNKPYIPENLSDLNDDSDHRTVTDAEKTTWNNKSDFSGSYNDLTDKPVIPDAQIQSDWNQNDNTKADFIKNKPSIPSAQVQSDWNESDSSKADYIKNKPIIPAEQVNSDWDAESGKAQILNKPSIPTALADLTDDSTHRTVTDTEKTAWNSGEANVQSNWNETDTTSDAYIQNKPTIPSVVANPGNTTGTLSSIGIDGTNYAISGGSGGGAVDSVNGQTGVVVLDAEDVGALPDDTPLFSGDYEDLTNKPTIPTVNNSTITIQKNGQNVDTFTLNQATNKAIDIPVPTKTSDITNDSSFITNTVNNLANYYLKSETYTKTEVSNLIDAAVNGRFEKVQTLPVTGEANVIYLVPKTTALTNNVYDEYIWQDNAWELLGSTEIDLSGYVTDTDLTTALANYVTTSAFNTAIANYYTKTEVGNLLDDKVDKVSGKGLSTNDYSNTDKAIVDGVTSALANKADKVSGATNGNLAGLDASGNLADSGWASDKTTTSASGNPISISGLKSNQLAINPIITLDPIQAGSGDPSPSNVRAISGYDKIEVLSCGKNILNYNAWKNCVVNNGTGVYENNGVTLTATANDCYTGWRDADFPTDAIIPVNAGDVITLSWEETTNKSGIVVIFPNGSTTGTAYIDNSEGKSVSYTVSNGISFITFRFGVTNSGETISYKNIQIELGSSATSYEPYKEATDIQFQLGQTIYGGSLDLETGVLTVKYGIVDLGDLTWKNDTTTRPADGATIHAHYASLTDCKTVANTDIGNMYCAIYQASTVAEVDRGGGTTVMDAIMGGADGNNRIWVYDSRYNDTSATDFKTVMSGVMLIYELATPYTIQLTPHEISLLKDYAYISTNGTNMSFSYKNGEMASLADVEQLGKTINWLEVVNYPYSLFSWDDNEKVFKLTVNIDNDRLLGFMVQATNGSAIMSAYYNASTGILRVFGWIPIIALPADSTYQFVCNAVLRKNV